MTRIRYKVNELGWKVSDPILTGHGFTIAEYKGLNYRLLNYDTNVIIIEGTAVNSAQLKKTMRAELVSLGANFSDEIRKRKNERT